MAKYIDDPNIGEELRDLVEGFGIVYEDVLRIEITPLEVSVEVCLHDENGSKYADPETGEVAKEVLTFPVQT